MVPKRAIFTLLTKCRPPSVTLSKLLGSGSGRVGGEGLKVGLARRMLAFQSRTARKNLVDPCITMATQQTQSRLLRPQLPASKYLGTFYRAKK